MKITFKDVVAARDKADEAKAELSAVEHKYLKCKGWEYTCQTPGSYWMWAKKFTDGRTMLVFEDVALRYEESEDDPLF